jgi:hypothetical protein
MVQPEDNSSPIERGSESPPAGASTSGADAPQKVCKGCGKNLARHWRFKRKGVYYCRPCLRQHVALRRLERRRAARKTIVLLVILATCLLVLAACFIADSLSLRGIF